jgi:hypothetical protein
MTLSPRQRNLTVAFIVLGFFVMMFLWSEQIKEVRSREFPLLVSGTGIVLAVLDVIAHTETSIGRRIGLVLSGSAHMIDDGFIVGVKRELIVMLWIVAATMLMVLFGFVVGIPAFVFGYSILHARRTMRQSTLAAIAIVLAIWIGFELLLNYELYPGLLFLS